MTNNLSIDYGMTYNFSIKIINKKKPFINLFSQLSLAILVCNLCSLNNYLIKLTKTITTGSGR